MPQTAGINCALETLIFLASDPKKILKKMDHFSKREIGTVACSIEKGGT